MKHPNKAKAMKIMELLLLYYYKRKSIQSAYFPCRMVELSSEFGFCEESVLGAAFFASSLINLLDDIDEGCQWGHLALSLLSRSQDINRTLPKVYLTVYWNVLPHREPLQSTLEPLFQGYRMAFTNGDIECALLSATLYFARSFNTGVNIQSLIDELEAFSYQHRKQVRYIFCHVLPLYVILCKFRGVETKALLREKTLVQLEESLAEALKQKDFAAAHAMVTYQTMHAFIFRDLNTARRLIEMHRKYFGGGNIDEPLLKYVRFNNM
jgi:ATP-dependent RNA helicase DDX31/DBP7